VTNLQRLRNYVGSHGNWDKNGLCTLHYQDKYLVCLAGNKNVFATLYPDNEMSRETITEQAALFVLAHFGKTKVLENPLLVTA
jgi:hypothetical protein